MSKIDPVKAGDEITQGLLDRIVDQLERFHNLRSGSPCIVVTDGPSGKLLDLDLPVPTWALLSGSSSPYSFTEVRDGPGGTWVSMANGDSGTSNVYEVNGKSGLAGKVVPITWTSAGDWRFAWIGVGPPPNPCIGHGNRINFQLTGCGTCMVSGANVDFVLSGVTVHSAVTNTSGQASYSEPAPGTYTVNWSVPGTIFSGSGTAIVTGACNTPSTVFATVSVPAGYQCCSARMLPFPVNANLFITDAAGTRPFGSTGCTTYNGYALQTFLNCGGTCTNQFNLSTSYIPVSVFPADPCGYLNAHGNCPAFAGPGDPSSTGVIALASSENPFEISGTWGATGCGFYTSSPLAGSSFLVHT